MYQRVLWKLRNAFSNASCDGFLPGNISFTNSPEMNYAFPELEITMYSFSRGMAFMILYAVLRASRLIGPLFEEKVHFDIFDQASLYAISWNSAWLVTVIAIPTYFQFLLTPSYAESFLAINTIYLFIDLIVFWLPLQETNRILVPHTVSNLLYFRLHSC